MLILPDGRSALDHAADECDDGERAAIIEAALLSIPRTQAEFMVAARLMVDVVENGVLNDPATARAHAHAILEAVEAGRVDWQVLGLLRALLPLCNVLADPRPLKAVVSMMEAFRPQSIA